jgi:hypothetical protein
MRLLSRLRLTGRSPIKLALASDLDGGFAHEDEAIEVAEQDGDADG